MDKEERVKRRARNMLCSECGNTSQFRGDWEVFISKMESIRKIEKVNVKEILSIIRGRITNEQERIEEKARIGMLM